ncbi:MAG: hypothetical protein HG423_014155 [Propionibacterium sp.]|nr:hypothetical protein [Propionibacterium sp.]
MTLIEIPCPICGGATKTLPRYPRRVCSTCAAKASDESGRALEFFNTSFGGGFIAYYVDSNQTEIYPSHRCFIDGISCYADEARFGGIVIEPLTDQPE